MLASNIRLLIQEGAWLGQSASFSNGRTGIDQSYLGDFLFAAEPAHAALFLFFNQLLLSFKSPENTIASSVPTFHP